MNQKLIDANTIANKNVGNYDTVVAEYNWDNITYNVCRFLSWYC